MRRGWAVLPWTSKARRVNIKSWACGLGATDVDSQVGCADVTSWARGCHKLGAQMSGVGRVRVVNSTAEDIAH